MRGTVGGRSNVARSASPVALPIRVQAAQVGTPCITESFDTADSETVIGPDLSWTLQKAAQAFPSDGTSDIFNYTSDSHGLYSGGLHIVGNRLSLAKPAVSPSSADGAYGTPYWGVTNGDSILETSLPSQDCRVTYTLAAVPVTADDGTSATAVCHRWGASPYLRFDDDTFDGWELFLSNVGASDGFATVYWDGGSKSFDPGTIAPFTAGEVIAFTVTGAGADTHITATRDSVSFVDLSGTDLSTANGGDFSGLPSGTKADLSLFMQGAALTDDAGPGNSPHYPFYGPISDAMNDTLAIDDVQFCPA